MVVTSEWVLHVTLGTALNAQAAPAAGNVMAKWSATAGALTGGLFTSDPVVLNGLVHLGVVGTAKLRAHWLRLVQDGLKDDAAMSLQDFAGSRDEIIDGLAGLDQKHHPPRGL